MAIAAVTRAMKYQRTFGSAGRSATGGLIRFVPLNSAVTMSPRQPHQRCSLAWKICVNCYLAIVHFKPLRGVQKLKLPGLFQAIVLLRSWRLRRTHRLPDTIGIAVRLVDPIMLQQHLL